MSNEFADLVEAPDAANTPDEPAAATRIDGVVIGKLVGFKDRGDTPLITYPGQPGPAALAAMRMIDLHTAHVGREVVLAFERGNPQRPIILGCLHEHDDRAQLPRGDSVQLEADGQRFVLSADRELVLRCGKASIRLLHTGEIFVDGAAISSRATGAHRIKGGSIQLN
jgi:hypothetical protein